MRRTPPQRRPVVPAPARGAHPALTLHPASPLTATPNPNTHTGKAFIRIRYILDETFQRNWRNWQDGGTTAEDALEGLDEDGADAGASAEAASA